MSAEARRKYGVTLRVLGGMSAYRTYAEQVWLWNNSPHAHNPTWVARPGTSNHGWGLAVDLSSYSHRRIVDQIGAKYGWAKRWSDAQAEWWHLKWAGFGTTQTVYLPTIRKGSAKKRTITHLQRLLRSLHMTRVVNGNYGIWTRRAVRRFQAKHHLTVDGVVGPATWRAIYKATGNTLRHEPGTTI